MLSFLKKCGLLLLLIIALIALLLLFEPIFMRLFSKNKPSDIKVYQVSSTQEQEMNKMPQKTYIRDMNGKEAHQKLSMPENVEPTGKGISIRDDSKSPSTQAQTRFQNDKGDKKPLTKRSPKEGITEAVAKEKRLQEIESEIEALAPHTGKGNHAITLRMLDLEEEKLTILQEQGLLHTHGVNPFNEIKMIRLVVSSITDGKAPVSIGEQIASYLEEDGQHEAAAMYRAATRRAIENGDEFYKLEHLEDN